MTISAQWNVKWGWAGGILALFLLGSHAAAQETPAPQKAVDWLRGSGETLEIRIHGEIAATDKKAAAGAKVTAKIISGDSQTIALPASRDANRFEVWIPVGKLQWFGLHLDCESMDGKLSATERIGLERMRQSAMDCVTLRLVPFDRTVEIKVLDKGAPVEGAHVRVDSVIRRGMLSTTDKEGVARYGMFKDENPTQVTAWTDDFRIGGHHFGGGKPIRDPKAALHLIELNGCRPQRIKVVNTESDSPVAGLKLTLQISTPSPNYNYLGRIPASTMTTDEKGDAAFPWFPDWPAHHFYTDLHNKEWVKAEKDVINADGLLEIRVKKSQFANRKPITGEVTSVDGNPGGFCVEMRSFQGEVEDRSDVLHAFTDPQGRFSMQVLPGSTYCAKVHGQKLLSKMIAVTPYDPKSNSFNTPKLAVTEGAPVEISVTQGPNKTPIRGINISLRANHPYSWIEDGKTRDGTGSRDTWGKADEKGTWKTFAMPGEEIEAHIYEPDWNLEKTTTVKAGEITKIELNRLTIGKQKILGQLTLPPDIDTRLADAEVVMESLDGVSIDEYNIKVDAEGNFSFETTAAVFGIFASTVDNKAAARAIVRAGDAGEFLTIPLMATSDFEGRLLDEEGAPIANHTIEAAILVQRNMEEGETGRRGFTVKTMTAKTNEKGDYTFKGIPYYVNLTLETATPGDPKSSRYLDGAFLRPGEARPRQISRLSSNSPKVLPLQDRFDSGLRDAKLGGYRMMVVLFEPTEKNEEFVNLNFYNYDQIPEVASYMHVYHRTGGPKWLPASSEFAKSKGWPEAKEGKIVAIAMDSDGKELGRVEVDAKDAAASEKAVKFVRDFAPQPDDAKKKWDEAFALAAKTNRKVWVRVSQRFCGPCFVLSRWLDDQKGLIEKDYVLLKVCDVRDLGGADVAARFWDWKSGNGVPFHAIFDSSGAKIIDSAGPLGNIGAPSGYEGGKHLRKMLMESRKNLTDEEIDKLIKSLPE